MSFRIHHRLGALLSLGAILLFLPGCASTPEKRIAHNQEFFLSLPEEKQELIESGEIALGFTPEMVRLALGSPDRTQRRVTAEVKELHWIYLGSFLVIDSYQVRDFARFSREYHRRQVDRTRQQFYEQMRLVFRDGVLEEIGENRRGE